MPLSAAHAHQEPVLPAVGDLEHGRELELAPRDRAAQSLQRLVATDHPALPVRAEPYAARATAAAK